MIRKGLINRIINLQVFSCFHHHNYPLFFLVTLTSSIGMTMMMVTLGWLVLEMTDSPFLLGMVWVARSTPNLILGILSGTIADKFDRRKLLIIVSMILATCAFAMGALIFTELIQIWHVFTIAVIMGATMTFNMPARQAFAVDIVGQEDAMNAISMGTVAMRIIGIFGGVTAGVVIELFGVEWPFFIMVISYIIAIILLLNIRGVKRITVSEEQSVKESVIEAIKLIGKNQIILILVVMCVSCQILGFSSMVVLPIMARDVLKVGATGLGLLSTASSVGGLIGALTLASLGNYQYKGRLMLGIFLCFGIFLILFSQSPWFLLTLFFYGLVGSMTAGFDAMQHTMLQLNVAEDQRGRAMGIWMLCMGSTPVGSTLIGIMASNFGAQLAITINGGAIIIIFFIVLIFVPRLRRA
ncbi:MFS transporter [Chloroflexota bacterium]